MKIVPISKFEYKVFPIKEDEAFIEITEEEYAGLENHTHCFNDDLTAVVEYVKSETELEKERIQAHNFELRIRISELKGQLALTDYKTLKLFEGLITEAEYAETRVLRESLRLQINDLESQIITEE